jgi:hypothetical protein
VVWTAFTWLTAPNYVSEGRRSESQLTHSGSFTRLVRSNLAAQAAEQIELTAVLSCAVLVF